jgi:trehalose 6-phosphate synthase/phosphatase
VERPIRIVSNRLPVTLQRGAAGLEQRRSSGGLVSALEPVLQRRGGRWIGWAGARLGPDEQLDTSEIGYEMGPVELSRNEVQRYYHGFSNETLWPLFHCFPSRARFELRNWEVYDEVNARFADAAAQGASREDLIWIHDYQLTTAPLHLRRRVPDARIAFFLHVPFPPLDVYRTLPWSRDVLHGMLASDLIGFHVRGYARNFLDCVQRLLSARVDLQSGLIEHGERTVQVQAFPIGIDYKSFEQRASEGPADRDLQQQRIILGVDRLDYTKGIPQRFQAFEHLLEQHPEHREQVVLLQIAVPSRDQVSEYRDLKREIDELVGRINGRFATATWSPIRYLYRSIPQTRLCTLYREADVALITPLRDGMNLVAKEYVASQVDDPGVLVLSQMAGAAETMREALLVNPLNREGMADQLHRALTMEEPERRSRMVALRRRESEQNVHRWVEDFLVAAQRAAVKLEPITDEDFDRWIGRFLADRQLALFLDYDGTLTPLRRHPSEALLAPEMRATLQRLAARDDTDVTVVSGRGLADVEKLVSVPGVTFAGNHGLEISGPGLEYHHEDVEHYRSRLAELTPLLDEICIPGAWVEAKGASLTVHFREAEESQHERFADEARQVIQRAGFQARDAHCAIEARPPIGWDKGHAVLHILRSRYGLAWSASVRSIYAGDDLTDEDPFRVLSGLGITFRIGPPDEATAALRNLPSVESMQALLSWLAKRPS